MKAVLIAPEFAASDGGIQRILRTYLKAMAADPAVTELALVALNDRPEHLIRIDLGANAKPCTATACAGSRPAFVRAVWTACAGAGRIVCGHLAQLPVAALAKRGDVQLAVVAHGIEAWAPLGPALRLALRRTERGFCVSRFTRDRLAANHPALAPHLRVVPNALDAAFFAAPVAPPPADHPPEILCVGRLCPADAYKGYDLLLRAFAALGPGAGGPRLRFIGDGADRARLESLAAGLGVADRVTFSGRVDDATLRAAFARCRCFALPSTGEGFGLVYLEALAAGRPCVGVRAAAVPELVTPEVGCLAEPDNPAALAAALRDCLARPWDPLRLRAAAEAYDEARFAACLQSAWN